MLSQKVRNPILAALGLGVLATVAIGPSAYALEPTPTPTPTTSTSTSSSVSLGMQVTVSSGTFQAGDTAQVTVTLSTTDGEATGTTLSLSTDPATTTSPSCTSANPCAIGTVTTTAKDVAVAIDVPSSMTDSGSIVLTAVARADNASEVTEQATVDVTATQTSPSPSPTPKPAPSPSSEALPSSSPKPTASPTHSSSTSPGSGSSTSSTSNSGHHSGGGTTSTGGGSGRGGRTDGGANTSGGINSSIGAGSLTRPDAVSIPPGGLASNAPVLPPIAANPAPAPAGGNGLNPLAANMGSIRAADSTAPDVTFQRLASTQAAWLAALLVAFSLLMTQVRLARPRGARGGRKGTHRRPRHGMFSGS